MNSITAELMSVDITPLLNALIALIAAIITIFVIPWLKSKVGNEKMADFLRWVEIGVLAAEQLYTDFDCEAKKAYVVSLLNEKGFKFTESEVDAAIEGAVKTVHNQLYGAPAAKEVSAE